MTKLRGDVKAMHSELAQQGRELLQMQRITQAHLQSLAKGL
jgi:hypothetical protein